MKPTDEQQEIIDAFEAGYALVIEAGAGTGKSSTLKMLGESDDNKSGFYLAFNRAVADEARQKFPGNVGCSTAHSIAYRQIGHRYEHRLNGPRVFAKETAEKLGIRTWIKAPEGRKDISPWRIASLSMQTVRKFCHSSDAEVGPRHVPFIPGYEPVMDRIREAVVPWAQTIWEDVRQPNGRFGFEHDHYLKIWALGRPKLSGDFIMLDEGQDTNPVLAQVFMDQTHMQRVIVGDSRQQLFEWRGAKDIMSVFDADERLFLTQSFRFGDPIAEEANRWLEYLDAPIRLRGLDTIQSSLERIERPDAVLCRTNADVIDQTMAAQEAGIPVAIVGGTKEIEDLAVAAQALQSGERTSHPDLSSFKTWSDVMSYVADEQPDGTFGVFMRLIERYGVLRVLQVVRGCVPEARAQRLVATVHKVKGLEWPSVRVDTGVLSEESLSSLDPSPQEMMIAYVAVTRAKNQLDTSSLGAFHERRQRAKKIHEEREKRLAGRTTS